MSVTDGNRTPVSDALSYATNSARARVCEAWSLLGSSELYEEDLIIPRYSLHFN